MRISIILFAFICFISCHSEKKKKQQEHLGLISKIDSIVITHEFSGVILLFSDSLELYSKAVGLSDIENGIRMEMNDQFVIGSISKQITAVLLLQAYEKGMLDLDDRIADYLPEIDQPWTKEVSIHQLLAHTHGIVALDQSLAFEPGAQFSYSQLGYELIAQILEKATEKSFESLSTELFEKHGLNQTSHPSSQNHESLVKAYVQNENGTLAYTTHSLDNYVPAGSFISCATDLKKWNELLHSGQLVSLKTLKAMSTKYSVRNHPIFGTVNYGYGLLFKDGEQEIEIGALGYAPGFVSACYYYPQTKLNLIVLQNTAKNLNDFRQTFIVHTALMDLIRAESTLIVKQR